MHQRVNEDFDYETLPPNLTSIVCLFSYFIDRQSSNQAQNKQVTTVNFVKIKQKSLIK